MSPSSSCRRSRGITLLEALVALLVLSLGLLGFARLQPAWHAHAELSRQRSEAVRLAQQEIERARAEAEPAPAEREVAPEEAGSTTAYRLTRHVDDGAVPNAAAISVTVEWTDRTLAPQSLTLDGLVARIDPALSATVAQQPRIVPVAGPASRAVAIPIGARDLGDGRSVFRPMGETTTAWIFDNRSGDVIARCDLPSPRANAELTVDELVDCTYAIGMTVSGEVHFSAAEPPDAASANDAPLPLTVELLLERAATFPIAPWCAAEPVEHGAQRYVAYQCVVIPPVGLRRWSGRTRIVPTAGWNIGTAPEDWRVCRYARDLDGSGAIDANAEHPAIYQNVDRTLMRQNFLVVRGNAACPSAGDGRTEARSSTEPHQP